MNLIELNLQLTNFSDFKKQILFGASSLFNEIVILDSNESQGVDPYGNYNYLAAIGASRKLVLEDGNDAKKFATKLSTNNKWMFGGFSYEFKNKWWNLSPLHKKSLWPIAFFFEPIILVKISKENPESIVVQLDESYLAKWNEILNYKIIEFEVDKIQFKSEVSKRNYISKINEIKEDIRNGEYYELNYCLKFEAKSRQIHAASVFNNLTLISPNPFSAYVKWGSNHALCASPERFLVKKESKVLSQPMKGTSRRYQNTELDNESKINLSNSSKDMAENVMIVDLVRNDLSRNCKPGTVNVEELCEVYSFPNVHQMISTVSGELGNNENGIQALLDSFPMGSMTGAPKTKVMNKIEEIEETERGFYSGCMGYINPEGDFDFNVMIRTLFYYDQHALLEYYAGGAITSDSVPEEEYEEVLLKAEILNKLF